MLYKFYIQFCIKLACSIWNFHILENSTKLVVLIIVSLPNPVGDFVFVCILVLVFYLVLDYVLLHVFVPVHDFVLIHVLVANLHLMLNLVPNLLPCPPRKPQACLEPFTTFHACPTWCHYNRKISTLFYPIFYFLRLLKLGPFASSKKIWES